MRVLITAGSTEIMIDKVRSIGNIFKGNTGTKIALYFQALGANVTLLTSAPHIDNRSISVLPFRTFNDLAEVMEREILSGNYDAIIHSAAVSDYRVTRVLIQEGTTFQEIDDSRKISGSHNRLYLELAPTIKLVDQVRDPWKFQGKLVKFKLQVGISDTELIDIAQKSLAVSRADFIVANCLEWCRERAYIIDASGACESVLRNDLPEKLYRRLV